MGAQRVRKLFAGTTRICRDVPDSDAILAATGFLYEMKGNYREAIQNRQHRDADSKLTAPLGQSLLPSSRWRIGCGQPALADFAPSVSDWRSRAATTR
jgi:hypothetical protein